MSIRSIIAISIFEFLMVSYHKLYFRYNQKFLSRRITVAVEIYDHFVIAYDTIKSATIKIIYT